MEKLVVDSDCGVDDALALMLALSSNRGRVVAVTCCFGNTTVENACQNVMRTLSVCKQPKIPIYKGSSGPLLSKRRRIVEDFHCADGLGNCAHQFSTGALETSNVPAVMALIKLSMEQPNEITLLALAPLTNIALAHRIDPQFTQRLKGIICMGGNYKGVGNTTEVAEYNFYCDPEAADIVLGESLCPVTMIPWETTLEFGLKLTLYDRMAQVTTAKGRFFSQIGKILYDYAGTIRSDRTADCDLLAAAVALYPETVVCSIEHPLSVESGGTFCRGLTILLNDASIAETGRSKLVKIITGLDRELLDKLRFDMLQDSDIHV